MLFPTGFGDKLPSTPWFTIGVVSVTTAFMVFIHKDLSELSKKNQNSEQAQELEKEQIKFVALNCPKFDISDNVCGFIQKVLKTESKEKSTQDRSVASVYNEAKEEYKPTKTEKEFILEWIENINEPTLLEKKFSSALEGTQELDQKIKDYKKVKIAEMKSAGFMTSDNIGPMSALKSFFAHSGASHLFGNMTALFFFLMILEMRYSKWALTLIYVLGGMASFYAEILLSNRTDLSIVGASGGVSAIMGSFWIAFYRKKTRMLLTDFAKPFLGRHVFTPVSWSIPVFVLISDIIGVISYRDGAHSVAHIAHLAGFAFGCLAILVLDRLTHVGPHTIYQNEVEILEDTSLSREQIQIRSLHVLSWNSANSQAFRNMMAEVNSENKLYHKFIKNHASSCLQTIYDSKDVVLMKEVIASIQNISAYHLLIKKMPASIAQWSARVAMQSKQWLPSLYTCGYIAERFANKRNSEAILSIIERLLVDGVQGEKYEEMKEWYKTVQNPLLKKILIEKHPFLLETEILTGVEQNVA